MASCRSLSWVILVLTVPCVLTTPTTQDVNSPDHILVLYPNHPVKADCGRDREIEWLFSDAAEGRHSLEDYCRAKNLQCNASGSSIVIIPPDSSVTNVHLYCMDVQTRRPIRVFDLRGSWTGDKRPDEEIECPFIPHHQLTLSTTGMISPDTHSISNCRWLHEKTPLSTRAETLELDGSQLGEIKYKCRVGPKGTSLDEQIIASFYVKMASEGHEEPWDSSTCHYKKNELVISETTTEVADDTTAANPGERTAANPGERTAANPGEPTAANPGEPTAANPGERTALDMTSSKSSAASHGNAEDIKDASTTKEPTKPASTISIRNVLIGVLFVVSIVAVLFAVFFYRRYQNNRQQHGDRVSAAEQGQEMKKPRKPEEQLLVVNRDTPVHVNEPQNTG